ncbi:family 43 glycosylhydrolase [Jonesia quinghaiensis]|uniref:family 43 glycosylhydrolase n=1 Tax=Jonesia quinghaiensis TaxID=262806 RepID=UPI0004234B1D|nr:family 43 glycosylhydrolase [Jonesia quinghaiensis]
MTRTRSTTRAVAVALTLSLAGIVAQAPAQAGGSDSPQPILHYPLDDTSGTTARDASGNGHDGTINGSPTLTGAQGYTLDGVDDAIKLPNNILSDLDSITVSLDVLIDPAQQTPYFIYGLGNTATSSAGTGYLFATGNTYRTSISATNWSGEQNVNSGANLPRGVWNTITYTLDDSTNTAISYLNGREVATNTNVTVTPASLGNGTTTSNFIGKSNYTSDKNLRGSVKNFRIYNTALTADEVAELAPSDADIIARDLEALDLGDTTGVISNLTLRTSGVGGSTISWTSSDPGVLTNRGEVTRPNAGEPDATVTLTATATLGNTSDTREFTVTVLADSSDQQIVDAARDTLTVNTIDDVKGNITLPSEHARTSVTWESANPSVVSTQGIVTRQPQATTVELTATLTRGEATTTKTFTAQVRPAYEVDEYEGYAFAYFTGDSKAGENIFLAASKGNNALQWQELNGGEPILKSTKGTEGLRDPFIIRSPEGDTFYLIATDLSIGGGTSWDASQRTGSRHVEIWESSDLINWSEQRHVEVSPPEAGNTWAPEAYYDESIGAYILFWASKLYDSQDTDHTGNTYNRMMFAVTRDFVTFTEPEIWQDQGMSRIDSTVIKDGDTYHRFTKDEGAGGTGCSDIIQERSTTLRAQLDEWEMVTSCIGKKAGTSAVEGPTVFAANPGDVNGESFYLFVDEYGGRGYIPLATKDLNNPDWKVPASYDLPAKPRHGTVVPVTKAELNALTNAPSAAPVNDEGEILRYSFDSQSGSTLTDVSGNGADATVQGTAQWTDTSLQFNGTNTFVELPDNLMTELDEITIEADVRLAAGLTGDYFLYGLGNSSQGAGNGYIFTSANRNNYRTSISPSNWNGEQTAASGQALAADTWHHLTYTLADGTATVYLNGVAVGTQTGVTTKPGDIGGGITTSNLLGKSLYSADKLFAGQMREFAIYNRALDAREVLGLSGNFGALLDVSVTTPQVLAHNPIIDAEQRTVVLPVTAGTNVKTLAPTFSTADSVTVNPASGSVQDLSSPVTYTLTGPSGTQPVTWTISAVEVRTPVLPGLYADPNIAVFGDTYYIYATSDGFPGWGGKEFYVWSSKDLVTWKRSESPILTLDGDAGDVPWAAGNAWAPTIGEKDGKYYFYFSGHNTALNRKTIGVAVADSPTGPFVATDEPIILNNEAITSGQAIDPATFHDPVTGKDFLLWGNGSPVMAELNADMTSIKADTLTRMTGLTDFREGLFVNYRKGMYHLTYSIDDTGSPNYRVGYATATTITGPWTYRGVVLEKDPTLGILGTGHNSVLNVPGTDDWYMAYHRFAIPDGDGTHRETTIDRVTFDATTGLMNPVTPTLGGVTAQKVPSPDPAPEPEEPKELSATRPVVTGQAVVGTTLTAKTGAWTKGTSFSYQWYANGKAIKGATKKSLKLSSAREGQRITVKVTGKKSGYTTRSLTSTATKKVMRAATPKISGSVKVGKKLTAKPGKWTKGTTLSYRWYANGKAISGAKKSTLTVKKSLQGKRITVVVTGKKSGYTTVSAGSDRTKPVKR